MKLSKFKIEEDTLSAFQTYLLSNSKVKQISKEFDFYAVVFYKEENIKTSIVYLQYPIGNVYWYVDFEKYINTHILSEECVFKKEWLKLLKNLKAQIKKEFNNLQEPLKNIDPKDIITKQLRYNLRDYQAADLEQLLIKYNYWDRRGLILSEPRTGKTRIALAAVAELLVPGDVCLVICPKSAELGWHSEIIKINGKSPLFLENCVTKISKLKDLKLDTDLINVNIISYDLFKKLTIPQIRQLTLKSKHILFIGDELHRLRNFKTEQSKAIFNFKEFCERDKVNLGIIGLTGTPAVKESYDVFGLLSCINESKILLKPYYSSFNSFKEYFYYCEDTSFGKVAKALRREHELNYLLQICSVQTKQRELAFFKYYKKKYLKVTLKMDSKQKEIYCAVYADMEYDEDIDCQNKLVQLVRLQQICIDPSGLVASYEPISPKLKWLIQFAKTNNIKFIIACKKTTPLKHLMKLFDEHGIKYSSILGEYSYNERLENITRFSSQNDVKCMILQLDTGREALTLPEAQATIFLDRDFAQGFNEQAEARMTPVDGKACTKYVIDLVMENTKEEEIYQTLVMKKKSIDAINLVFKSRKGE